MLLTADALVLAHVGVLIVAALYYVITQTNPTVKHWWDTTMTPASLRHDIRAVGEGVLASCMAQAIVWNPFQRSHQKTGRVFRQVRQRFRVPIGVAAVVSAAIIGTVAFIIGEGVLHWLSLHPTDHRPTGSLWNRTLTLWRSSWDKKALGFLAAVAARRPLHVLFDEAQAYFAGRRASASTGLRWYHPPVFKARYNYLTENPQDQRHYPALLTSLVGAAVLAGIALAGYGYYILTYQA
ncbi:MAG: hypothetical protein M3137_04165 [Actinomycetota bacterium]|nr:hypothetical protein [Actinomycetota bacterium]